MRVFLICLVTMLFGPAARSQEQPATADVEAFFALVQTGGASAVEAALRQNPALAIATDRFGFQAIHVLDYADFDAVLALLIAHGADINAQNNDGMSLLHILIDMEFLPHVLRAGADLELKDTLGRTPIMVHLTEPEGLEMVIMLLQAGADPHATDESGQSVHDYALLWGDPMLADIVAKAGDVGGN